MVGTGGRGDGSPPVVSLSKAYPGWDLAAHKQYTADKCSFSSSIEHFLNNIANATSTLFPVTPQCRNI